MLMTKFRYVYFRLEVKEKKINELEETISSTQKQLASLVIHLRRIINCGLQRIELTFLLKHIYFIFYLIFIPSVLRHSRVGDRKGIWLVEELRVLVCC